MLSGFRYLLAVNDSPTHNISHNALWFMCVFCHRTLRTRLRPTQTTLCLRRISNSLRSSEFEVCTRKGRAWALSSTGYLKVYLKFSFWP